MPTCFRPESSKPGAWAFAGSWSGSRGGRNRVQMLFDYAQAKPGQTVLIHGAAGNVGAYAVQLASQAGLQVFAPASSGDAPHLQSPRPPTLIAYNTPKFQE